MARPSFISRSLRVLLARLSPPVLVCLPSSTVEARVCGEAQERILSSSTRETRIMRAMHVPRAPHPLVSSARCNRAAELCALCARVDNGCARFPPTQWETFGRMPRCIGRKEKKRERTERKNRFADHLSMIPQTCAMGDWFRSCGRLLEISSIFENREERQVSKEIAP